MTTADEPIVAGESAFALLAIIRQIKTRPAKNGMMHGDLRMPTQEMAPFIRALERTDTELRIEEQLGLAPDHVHRTAKQRRVDALVVLIQQVLDATEKSNDAGTER
jgi:hypothetical protein